MNFLIVFVSHWLAPYLIIQDILFLCQWIGQLLQFGRSYCNDDNGWEPKRNLFKWRDSWRWIFAGIWCRSRMWKRWTALKQYTASGTTSLDGPANPRSRHTHNGWDQPDGVRELHFVVGVVDKIVYAREIIASYISCKNWHWFATRRELSNSKNTHGGIYEGSGERLLHGDLRSLLDSTIERSVRISVDKISYWAKLHTSRSS